MALSASSWLSLIAQFAPYILAAIPGVPKAIIPFVTAGIQAAETIPGAPGEQKLAAAVQIAQAGFSAAQAVGAHIDAPVINEALPAATTAVVQIVNAIQRQGVPALGSGVSDPNLQALAEHLETAGIALQQAAEVVAAMAGTPVPPDPPSHAITTAAELDAALASAKTGDVLTLDPALRYLTPLNLTVSVTLQNAAPIVGRATRLELMPRFADGLTVTAPNVHLMGIEIMKIDPLTDILVLTGAGCLVEGCRVLGDATHGAKRGIAGNAPNVTVVRCYVDDCFGPMPGNDTQAFCAWDSPGPFLLQDNYFSGGSETILFGGADPSSSANVPADITVRGNTITKNPAWRDKAIVKNLIEFKNARHYLVEDNDLSNCWGGEQGGYAFMITPRNQDGTAPYSEVRDGIIRNNRVSHVGAVLSLLGSDNVNPSAPLDGLVFEANDCTDVDHVAYNGNDKLYIIQRGPLNVTINGNRVQGPPAGSALYFGEAPNSCVQFAFTGNTVPNSLYGVMGASCAPGGLNDDKGSAWTTFVVSGTLADNVTVTS